VEKSYRNMKQILQNHPLVLQKAEEATRMAGLEPKRHSIRGGTDGARLSYMGLPTPNIATGGHNFHSRLEWISVQDMKKAVEIVVNLARAWASSQGALD
jgi:tripeptide aminopeptidase